MNVVGNEDETDSESDSSNDNSTLGIGQARIFWSLMIEGLNLATSAFIFLVLSRFFTLEEYGRLGALIAVSSIAGPLASFGSNWLLIKRVVVSDSPERDLGRTLVVTAIGTLAATAALSLFGPALLPTVERSTIFVFLLGQLAVFWLVELSVAYAVSLGRLQLGAGLRFVVAITRFGALAVFALSTERSLHHWAVVSAVAAAASFVVVHAVLRARTGRWPVPNLPERADLREGVAFAFGSSTEGFLSASDRPILLRFGFETATGFYSAGYRLVSLTFVPLMALLKSQDRAFFSEGAHGPERAFAAAKKVSMWGLTLTVPISLATFALAPFVVTVLPDSYSDSAQVLRFLAVLPAIKSIQFAFGNALSASGQQPTRVRATVVATAVNFGGNMLLIPVWSWRAAATTTIAAELLLTLLLVASARNAAAGSDAGGR